jgi:hypothetical protein
MWNKGALGFGVNREEKFVLAEQAPEEQVDVAIFGAITVAEVRLNGL